MEIPKNLQTSEVIARIDTQTGTGPEGIDPAAPPLGALFFLLESIMPQFAEVTNQQNYQICGLVDLPRLSMVIWRGRFE